jgi:hypothetical protein
MSSTTVSWRIATEQRRAALEALGVEMPKCLSGEPEDCGAGDMEHFSAYTATLMAHTQWDMFVLEHACPGQGTSAHLAEVFAHQCCEAQPDGFDDLDLPVRGQFAVLADAVDDHLGPENDRWLSDVDAIEDERLDD